VTLREFFSENFAGDLEYHPRRAALHLILGMITLCDWVFSPSETRFTVIPLVFALGSLTLFVKGVLLLRKSSEGLGLSEQELAKLSDPAVRKSSYPSRSSYSGFRHRCFTSLATSHAR
jgi:hypothetical protein